MISSAEQVHMETGMGIPFIQLNFENFGKWTTKICLKTTRKNLGSLEIELLWSDLPYLLLNIEGDKYTMEDFSGPYDMDKITMRRMNRVRLSM